MRVKMRVKATEFVRKFGRIQREVYDGPIEVTHFDHAIGYFVSPSDYAQLEELRVKSRENLRVGQLPEDALKDIRASEMSARHADLDALLDD